MHARFRVGAALTPLGDVDAFAVSATHDEPLVSLALHLPCKADVAVGVLVGRRGIDHEPAVFICGERTRIWIACCADQPENRIRGLMPVDAAVVRRPLGAICRQSMILFDPQRRAGIVALWNSSTNAPNGLEYEVMDMVYRLPPRDWLKIDTPGEAAPAGERPDNEGGGA